MADKEFFDLNKYKSLTDIEFCMHCENIKDAETFLKFLDKHKRTWCGGESYISRNNWEYYKNNTVYFFNVGQFDDINYVKGVHNSKIIILEFSDFNFKNKYSKYME